MKWFTHHKASEIFAYEAETADRIARTDPSYAADAKQLRVYAAEQEALALQALPPGKPRTLGITAVSACSLWFKAGQTDKARALAKKWIGHPEMPGFAKKQLADFI